jgi:hypothetical protein
MYSIITSGLELIGVPSGIKQANTLAAGPSLPAKWPVSISNPTISPDGGPSLMITLLPDKLKIVRIKIL